MKANIISIISPDAKDLDLGSIEHSPASQSILLQVFCRPEGEIEGEDAFQIVVHTPTSLAQEMRFSGYFLPRRFLIVQEYKADVIRTALRFIIEQSSGSNWEEAVDKLSRYMH